MTPHGGKGSPAALRARNRERVLLALLERIESGATQAELSDLTGLSRPSIGSLLGTLKPVLLPAAPGGSSAGRRAGAVYAVDPDAAWAAAIDIGRSHIYVAICNLLGAGGDELAHKLVLNPGFEISQSPVQTVEAAAQALNDLLDEAPDLDLNRLVGVTVGLPGPVAGDSPRDRVLNWGDFKAVREVRGALAGANAERWAERTSELEVIIDNDANLSAIAEHRWGAGKGLDDVLYIKWSTGLGAGLIIDGALRRGAGGAAGEIAHQPVPQEVSDRFEQAGESIEECPACGEQCYEAAIGFKPLLEDRGWTYEVVQDIARDPSHAEHGLLREWIEFRADVLGRALVPVVNAINPQLVAIDGILDHTMEGLFERPVRRSLDKHGAMAAVFSDLNVCGGHFTVSAAARGGLARALRELAPKVLLTPD